MTTNLDDIDLNSDVVPAENDVSPAATSSEPAGTVDASDAETLKDQPVKSQDKTPEKVGGQDGVFHGDNDSEGADANGVERKLESLDGGTDLVGVGSVDSGTSEKSGKVMELTPVAETESSKVEVNEGTSVELGDEARPQDAGVLSSLSGNEVVEVRVDKEIDSLSDKEANQGTGEQTSDSQENQDMDADEHAEISGGQTVASDISEEKGSQKDEGMRDMLDLVVDLKPYGRADGNVTDDDAAKSAASNLEFGVSDLVWGKVRSHPWWPGQIFDSSSASKMAEKYFKKDTYLIAYFGDQTFAWNEVSKIKPFRAYFSQMVKQSNLEEFHYAVDSALEEVSRRVEFGLACPCVPDYTKIRTQSIVNAGIREECGRRNGGDRCSSAATFDPAKLVAYVKALSQLPSGGADILELVTAQAHLLAFNRWKGYPHLPEFQMLTAWSENDLEISPEYGSENAGAELKDDERVPSGNRKSNSQDSSSQKRKQICGDGAYPNKKEKSSGDGAYPNKKEKSLADMLAERRLSLANTKSGVGVKTSETPISSTSDKKRKAVDSVCVDSVAKEKEVLFSSEVVSNSSQPRQTYRVGESILRAASQLKEQASMLKSFNGTSQKAAVNKCTDKSPSRKSKAKELLSTVDSQPEEMLSQLCVAAREPLEGCRFSESSVSFFTEFRNSKCLDRLGSQQDEQSSVKHVISETLTSESEQVKDPDGTETIIESIPEEKSSLETQKETGEFPSETLAGKDYSISGTEPESAVQVASGWNSEQENAVGTLDAEEAVTADGDTEEKSNDNSTLTALILNFTDLDSIPSVTNLNKIFSRFGPLKESQTEVLKKSSRAKVVFCRRADAETAFSSAGKYSTFGPSLVSYRLKYLHCTPSKSPRKNEN